MKRKREGFTLVELMVVAVIVAILAAVAIPLMSANKTRAMATEAEAGLGTIRTVLRGMYAETGHYNVDLDGDPITSDDPIDLPGLSTGDLNGKYFLDGDYEMSLQSQTYTLTATGSKADVAAVQITLNQDGDWTRDFEYSP
ncbi:MAG: prepilin-type N-terminal cleavage/methylation domain-containing protein [Kiritimatiellae bacterium]|nr:prepilin-type N-terminal cleavage/methylation domain-containing protein [Kiritimatiellia bacterium]